MTQSKSDCGISKCRLATTIMLVGRYEKIDKLEAEGAQVFHWNF